MDTIDVSPMGSVLTIVFTNNSFKPNERKPLVWVCRDKLQYDLAINELKTMNHITILNSGNSLVK